MKLFFYHGVIAGLWLCSSAGIANEAVNRYLGQAQYLGELPAETVHSVASWYDDAELRYSGNDADEQGVSLRFRPRFESERTAQNRIVELLNQQHGGQLEAQLNDEMRPRYRNLIELFEISSELEYLDARQQLNEQQLRLNRSLAETEDFRIAALQAAEFEFHRTRQLSERYRIRLQRQLQGFDSGSHPLLQKFLQHWKQQVVGWNEIIEVSQRLSLDFEDGQIGHGLARIDFEIAQQKLKLARSDSASWLKFVELKFVDRPGDQETSFGIAIPLGGDDSGIAQRAAEVNETSLSLQQNRIEFERGLSTASREIYWLRDQAELLASAEALLSRHYTALRKANQPALMLQLSNELLNNQKEANQLHIRGLRAYIDLLHGSGRLAATPLNNWLLARQPPL